jgi:hypothetical protein
VRLRFFFLGGADFHRGNEPIAAAGKGLDESRTIGIITECQPYLVDAVMDPVLEVDEGIIAPKLLLDLLSANEASCSSSKKGEDFEGLRLELDGAAVFDELAATRIQREAVKTEDLLLRRF